MPENRIMRAKADNTGTALVTQKGEIRVSVRNLVEFILRSGDIDNRHAASGDNAMQEGSRIHRMLQKRMGADYEAEVSLKFMLDTRDYVLLVEGRADGIIDNDQGIVVDEIKGTYRELYRMREADPVHVAQAKCYAYMYGLKREAKEIRVRMTYCNMESEELRYFYYDYTFQELESWFGELVASYRKWADFSWQWRKERQDSIEMLDFPFPYRRGQKELVTNVYSTIYHGKKLFLEAPTGVGKTISTVFPAVKAMGKGMAEKIFYLTAKTIARTVADETLEILRKKGLHFKSVILTAKEKACLAGDVVCNPEHCPFARGHYDRVNDAIYEIITCEERFSREIIETYALKHKVCPFELCLDLSNFADGIICDYNYVFDPHAYLKRFFAEGTRGDYLFLIDEAHNLLERGRDMYSAVLVKESFMELKREIKKEILAELSGQIEGQAELDLELISVKNTGVILKTAADKNTGVISTDPAIEESDITKGNGKEAFLPVVMMPEESEQNSDTAYFHGKKKHASGKSILVREGYGDLLISRLESCNRALLELKRNCEDCSIVEEIDEFVNRLTRLYSAMGDYLEEQEGKPPAVRENILDFYFDVGHFLQMYELMDENYVKYTRMCEDNTFMLKLFCVNPAQNLKACMKKGKSSILFSATFLPIQYYKGLLGGEVEDYEVYADSVFNREKCGLFVASDVTSKYTRRSETEYGNIARYIYEVVARRYGNYMVFCPSYSFMYNVHHAFTEIFCEKIPGGLMEDNITCILQKENMTEKEREEFLQNFHSVKEEILIGFCVMGGVFSEGIDLKNDCLIGAVIVGTGLPQVCFEREILKDYFDGAGKNGFDFAYRYPGMNKVLQAAGRVIRTEEDVGVVALLDERFLQTSTRRLFPREWDNFETVNLETIGRRIERFWDSWL